MAYMYLNNIGRDIGTPIAVGGNPMMYPLRKVVAAFRNVKPEVAVWEDGKGYSFSLWTTDGTNGETTQFYFELIKNYGNQWTTIKQTKGSSKHRPIYAYYDNKYYTTYVTIHDMAHLAGIDDYYKTSEANGNHYVEPKGEMFSGYDISGKYKSGPTYTKNAQMVSSKPMISGFDLERDFVRTVFETNRSTYQGIAEETGVPAKLICALHYRESRCNFNTYLHNGQMLGKPTTAVPKDVLFYDFKSAALDALKKKVWLRDLCNLSANSKDLVGMVTFAENWNGLGYHNKGVVSAYVYSGTTLYSKGKFIGDGKYDDNAIDQQAGVYLILMALEDL